MKRFGVGNPISLLFAVAALHAATVGATAQAKFSPNAARPPLLLRATPEERLRAAVHLMAQQVERAIQRGDTTALRGLVADPAIPDAERPVATRAGCRSLPDALAKLKAKPTTAHNIAGLPLGHLHYENEVITARTDGDTIATFSARLMDRSQRARILFIPLLFTLTRSGAGLKLARAPGVLVGVCGMAVSS